MDYHIRYTCTGELQNEIIDFIQRNTTKYIIAREFATREHLQIFAQTTITKKTWVNKFNLKFKNMDRRDKYVEPDKGKTKQYVCKENDIVSFRGFTQEQIDGFRSEYHQNLRPPPEIIFEPSSQVPTLEIHPFQKKVKKPTFMQEIRNTLEDEYPEKDWTKNDRQIVYKKVMYMLGQSCRNLDHIIISRMTYGVLNSLVKDKKEWLEYWFQKSFQEPMNVLPDCMEVEETDTAYVGPVNPEGC